MSLATKTELIELVESNPGLWKSGGSKSPHFKRELWNEIGLQIETTGSDARRQWEVLRDQFRREYKRFLHNKNYQSKWLFYNRMLFIKHELKIKDRHLSLGNSDNKEIGFDEPEPPNDVYYQMEDDKTNIQLEIDNLPKIQVRHDLQGSTDGSQVTLYAAAEETNILNRAEVPVASASHHPQYKDDENDCFSTQKKRRKMGTESSDDEDYHFMMSILPSLRSLKRTKKLRVRSKIMELIATELEAEYEMENQKKSSGD